MPVTSETILEHLLDLADEAQGNIAHYTKWENQQDRCYNKAYETFNRDIQNILRVLKIKGSVLSETDKDTFFSKVMKYETLDLLFYKGNMEQYMFLLSEDLKFKICQGFIKQKNVAGFHDLINNIDSAFLTQEKIEELFSYALIQEEHHGTSRFVDFFRRKDKGITKDLILSENSILELLKQALLNKKFYMADRLKDFVTDDLYVQVKKSVEAETDTAKSIVTMFEQKVVKANCRDDDDYVNGACSSSQALLPLSVLPCADPVKGIPLELCVAQEEWPARNPKRNKKCCCTIQ